MRSRLQALALPVLLAPIGTTAEPEAQPGRGSSQRS
jgi:hypothetical protein